MKITGVKIFMVAFSVELCTQPFEKCMNKFFWGLWYMHMEFISTQYFGKCYQLYLKCNIL